VHPAAARLQVVVDAFDPSVLVSDCATHVLDFASIKEEDLYDINIPLNLTVGECIRMQQHF
jgi:histone-arginine methyltransferase CARM1